MIQLKRVYETPAPSDGQRILVERLWPRGMRRTDLQLDAWAKDAAPSTQLRRWFAHEPEKWEDFQRRYRAELDAAPAAWALLAAAAGRGTLTLLYSARDPGQNSALVLRDYLLRHLDS